MWNWNCPAVLKAYIDAIIMPGALGAGEGKLAGKKLLFLYHKEEPMDQALARKAGTI